MAAQISGILSWVYWRERTKYYIVFWWLYARVQRKPWDRRIRYEEPRDSKVCRQSRRCVLCVSNFSKQSSRPWSTYVYRHWDFSEAFERVTNSFLVISESQTRINVCFTYFVKYLAKFKWHFSIYQLLLLHYIVLILTTVYKRKTLSE